MPKNFSRTSKFIPAPSQSELTEVASQILESLAAGRRPRQSQLNNHIQTLHRCIVEGFSLEVTRRILFRVHGLGISRSAINRFIRTQTILAKKAQQVRANRNTENASVKASK